MMRCCGCVLGKQQAMLFSTSTLTSIPTSSSSSSSSNMVMVQKMDVVGAQSIHDEERWLDSQRMMVEVEKVKPSDAWDKDKHKDKDKKKKKKNYLPNC